MRYDSEESVVAGCNGDARAEVNQSFEYVSKSVPLLKRYPCEQRVLHNINTPISSSTPWCPLIKYLHNSILKRYLRYLFSKYLVSCNKILFLVTNSIL